MHFSDEKKLLLSCLKIDFDEEHIHYIQSILLKKLDWQNVLAVAGQNQITSLFYHKLLQAGGERLVPDNILQELRKNYYAINYQNSCYFNELKNILLLFDSAMVEVVVLKGAALIGKIWKNAALRPMADIDVLIKKHDIIRAEKLMFNSGYIAREKSYRTKEWYRKYHHHLVPFYNPENGIITEIHTNIFPPDKSIQLDMNKLWTNAEPAKIADIDAKILCLEDIFIHLCLHLFVGTSVGGIKNLSDIAQTLKCFGERIDWEIIENYAIEVGITDYIYYALYTVNVLLCAEIDDQFLTRLKSKSSKKGFEDYLLKKLIIKTIIYDDSTHLLPAYYYAKLLALLFNNDPIQRKIISFIEYTFPKNIDFPPNDPETFSLKKTGLAYYFFRLFNLVFKLTYKVFRIIG